MVTQSFDSIEFKAKQRQEWDASADGWRKRSPQIVNWFQTVSDRLLDLAQIQPGDRVLDIATGIGEPAVSTARLVGPSGSVVAMDQSPQMLSIARERASTLGLKNIEFFESDAESIQTGEKPFDAVTCRFGLMFMPNLDGVLQRVWDVLAPEGRFTASVWSVPEKVPAMGIPMGIIQRLMDIPPPTPGTPSPFNLAELQGLENSLRGAGFSDVKNESVTTVWEGPSPSQFLDMLFDLSSGFAGALARQTEEKRAQVISALKEGFGQYTDTDGTVRIPNEAICVTGLKGVAA